MIAMIAFCPGIEKCITTIISLTLVVFTGWVDRRLPAQEAVSGVPGWAAGSPSRVQALINTGTYMVPANLMEQ
jgi:hypothetical protein